MMDDFKEQQLQEIEALESMYANEMRILCRDYPRVSIELVVRPDVPEFAELFGREVITLRTTLTAEYPNTLPLIELPDFDESQDDESQLNGTNSAFWSECIPKINAELEKTAQESVGMPMLFTLFSALQDFLVKSAECYLKNKDDLERKRAEQTEREEMARFEGTRVTVESFKNWNKAFMEEIRSKMTQEAKNQESQMANRLTGRQLFLADQSLNISDLQFLDVSKADEGEVEIDQALFEDDLDFDSDENDEDYKPDDSR